MKCFSDSAMTTRSLKCLKNFVCWFSVSKMYKTIKTGLIPESCWILPVYSCIWAGLERRLKRFLVPKGRYCRQKCPLPLMSIEYHLWSQMPFQKWCQVSAEKVTPWERKLKWELPEHQTLCSRFWRNINRNAKILFLQRLMRISLT